MSEKERKKGIPCRHCKKKRTVNLSGYCSKCTQYIPADYIPGSGKHIKINLQDILYINPRKPSASLSRAEQQGIGFLSAIGGR